jgi:hypothetical protein
MQTAALILIGYTMIWQWPGIQSDPTTVNLYVNDTSSQCFDDRDELRRAEPGLQVECYPNYAAKTADEAKARPVRVYHHHYRRVASR